MGTIWWVRLPTQSAHDCSHGSTAHRLYDVLVWWTCVRGPLTIEMDLPDPRHLLVLSSSRTAGLQERLEERLGMGRGGGPSLELCTASYRLSIDPS